MVLHFGLKLEDDSFTASLGAGTGRTSDLKIANDGDQGLSLPVLDRDIRLLSLNVRGNKPASPANSFEFRIYDSTDSGGGPAVNIRQPGSAVTAIVTIPSTAVTVGAAKETVTHDIRSLNLIIDAGVQPIVAARSVGSGNFVYTTSDSGSSPETPSNEFDSGAPQLEDPWNGTSSASSLAIWVEYELVAGSPSLTTPYSMIGSFIGRIPLSIVK